MFGKLNNVMIQKIGGGVNNQMKIRKGWKWFQELCKTEDI